jgi:hypothetical protein
MGATVTGRPADATWYRVKPSKITVGTSVRPFDASIDHDMKDEDYHHVPSAVRGQSIVGDDNGGRTGRFALSWNKRTVSLHQQ